MLQNIQIKRPFREYESEFIQSKNRQKTFKTSQRILVISAGFQSLQDQTPIKKHYLVVF